MAVDRKCPLLPMVIGAIFVLPVTASAQAPSYATRGETIRGTIASVQNVNHIFVADDRGYTDDVTLRTGATVFSNGLRLEPGQRVTIVGSAAGSTFMATRIATSGASPASSAAGVSSAAPPAAAYPAPVPLYYPVPYPAPVYYPAGPYYGYSGYGYGFGLGFTIALGSGRYGYHGGYRPHYRGYRPYYGGYRPVYRFSGSLHSLSMHGSIRVR